MASGTPANSKWINVASGGVNAEKNDLAISQEILEND